MLSFSSYEEGVRVVDFEILRSSDNGIVNILELQVSSDK